MSLSDSRQQISSPLVRPYVIDSMKEAGIIYVVDIEEVTGLNRWGYDAYRRELIKNANSIMLVARSLETGRGVIGFFAGWTVEDEMHINNIASHPDYRRIGIGESLMNAGIEQGRLRGARYVLLEVRASNSGAQSLYRKMGFRYVGRRRDYYRFPTEDALVMKFVLDDQ